MTGRWAMLAVGAALLPAALVMANDPPAHGPAHGAGHAAAPHSGSRWAPPPERHGPEAHGEGHGEGHGEEVNGPELAFRGCAYYSEAGFRGRRGEARGGTALEYVGDGWNDRIASIACAPGCSLSGFVDINYGGRRRVFTGATAAPGETWEGRISAIRTVCTAG